jgi:hypothetical protein
MGKRAQGMGTSLNGDPTGAWKEARLPGTFVLKKALETGTSLHRSPVGNQGGVSIYWEL